LKRGDIVTVALSGDYGRPRPAVVIQSDFLDETDSVLVCLISATPREASFYRATVAAGEATGLRQPSQIMADKIMAVRRGRCGPVIGRIDDSTRVALDRLLMFVTGVTD
jgi:mRNA interferase MazF